jgi:Suppressor of fused protein (SUFU)
MKKKDSKKNASVNGAKHRQAKIKRPTKTEQSQTDQSEQYVFNKELLVSSWKARDELFQSLFGEYASVSSPDYAPPDKDVDNQRLAVLGYAPDPIRPHWTYVTAGLSTPWLQQEPQEVSGFGLELMVKSPIEAEWPAQLLRTMAYYIFNHMGTLSPDVRLNLNSSIVAGSDSLLRNMLIWYADEAPDCWYQLPSGGFGLFMAIGITDDEMKLTESIHEEYGTWCMLQILRQIGLGQITDPSRPSVMDRKDINSVISSVRGFAEQFHSDFPNANRAYSVDEELN